MKNRRLRPAAKVLIILIVLAIAGIGIWKMADEKKEEANNKTEGSQVEILQDNGDLEITIPEDQESGGF